MRISEYTRKERKAFDHCVRVSDLTFELSQGGGNELIQGGSPLWNQVVGQFTACWVRPASHKCGSIVKNKLIGRRSFEESRFLDDLTEWMRKSGGWPSDGLFTRRTEVHGRVWVKELTGRAIRENVKDMCIREGLDARFFPAILYERVRRHQCVPLVCRRRTGEKEATTPRSPRYCKKHTTVLLQAMDLCRVKHSMQEWYQELRIVAQRRLGTERKEKRFDS